MSNLEKNIVKALFRFFEYTVGEGGEGEEIDMLNIVSNIGELWFSNLKGSWYSPLIFYTSIWCISWDALKTALKNFQSRKILNYEKYILKVQCRIADLYLEGIWQPSQWKYDMLRRSHVEALHYFNFKNAWYSFLTFVLHIFDYHAYY